MTALATSQFPALTEMVRNDFTTRAALFKTTIDPRRDLDEECGYPTEVTPADYRKFFDRGLGRRVVDVYPEESWQKDPMVTEDDEPQTETVFEGAWKELVKAKNLYHYLMRIDIMSGVGRYGILLIGLDDGRQLHEPADYNEGGGKVNREIIYIRALDESLATIATYENDPTNPRFGKPTMYNVNFVDSTVQALGSAANPPDIVSLRVHWTRVVHVADGRTTSEVLGTPRMQPVWNRLQDLEKVMGSSAEMFYKGGFPGISIESQPGNERGIVNAAAMKDMMWDYSQGLQRYMTLTGMTAKSLAPQIADPTSSMEVQLKVICTILGVPIRVFMGTEEGKLAGGQDADAWAGRLGTRQKKYITPMLVNPFIETCINLGVMPPAKNPQGYRVKWADLHEPSEGEKATTAKTQMEALSAYVQGDVVMMIPEEEALTHIMGFDDETAKAMLDGTTGIEETQMEANKPLPPVAAPGVGKPPVKAAAAKTGKPAVKAAAAKTGKPAVKK